MGTNDFQKRLERIGGNTDSPSGVSARAPTGNNGFGVSRIFWGVFGVIWGFVANTMVMFANANYEKAKADTDTPEMIQLVAGTGAFGIISWVFFIVLGVLSFLFMRQKKGLRMLVFGFLFGVTIASVALVAVSLNGSVG